MGGAERYYDEVGMVCRADATPILLNVCISPGEARYRLPLPAQTDNDALEFLEGLGGDEAGTGWAMRRIGIDAPVIRARYKQEVEDLARQIAERLKRGESIEAVAPWASAQRLQIVRRMRAGSGRPPRLFTRSGTGGSMAGAGAHIQTWCAVTRLRAFRGPRYLGASWPARRRPIRASIRRFCGVLPICGTAAVS